MTDTITKCVFGLGLGPKGTITCGKPVVYGRGNCPEHLPELMKALKTLKRLSDDAHESGDHDLAEAAEEAAGVIVAQQSEIDTLKKGVATVATLTSDRDRWYGQFVNETAAHSDLRQRILAELDRPINAAKS